MKRIITLTTDNGGDREDFSVLYSKSVLVTAGPSLSFLEPVFTNFDTNSGSIEGGYEETLNEIQNLGYIVEEIDEIIITTTES